MEEKIYTNIAPHWEIFLNDFFSVPTVLLVTFIAKLAKKYPDIVCTLCQSYTYLFHSICVLI